MSRYIDADKLLNPDNIIVMQDETGIDEFPCGNCTKWEELTDHLTEKGGEG